MQEVVICQQGRPNQAIFVSSLDIKLEDFRTSITERGLTVPKEWVFTTDVGSLISEDQEDRIFLRSVAKPYGDSGAVYIMLDPSMSMQQQQQQKNRLGRKNASSARTAGSVGNTNITYLETDLFEQIINFKSLRIIAIQITMLIFTEMFRSVLYLAVEAWKYYSSQKHNVSGIPGNMNAVGKLSKMQRQIDAL